MKANISITLDHDLVFAAKKAKEERGTPVATTINRWAKLGKETEEKKPKAK